ncbi:MAG: 23S rRNA (guanosine(2251)-2'-O)-methyltransferase RlmB [Prevotellaceae bacterium]|jgi:23S rRNA (guanosine2251-2'-O)-methyltransferase|nr:23S rRNA (guanosine(2251)-2'-O)-methyltransferase RlmB [Prevotellaceae bacterium]
MNHSTQSFASAAQQPQLIVGLRPVIEAIQAGREIERVLIKTGLDGDLFRSLLDLLHARHIPIQYVPAEKLNSLTTANHQGVAAFIPLIPYADLDNIIIDVTEKGGVPLVLLLDGVTDVRNFGAIARSAECAGVHAIVTPAKGAAAINADALKTSSGALNRIPVCRTPNLRTAIYYLKDSGLQIVSATEKADMPLYDCDFRLPTALVVGAEDTGISDAILKCSDVKVKIPLQGAIQSLNVSVAAAVALFEAVRQRM